jgi:hypothetical protein
MDEQSTSLGPCDGDWTRYSGFRSCSARCGSAHFASRSKQATQKRDHDRAPAMGHFTKQLGGAVMSASMLIPEVRFQLPNKARGRTRRQNGTAKSRSASALTFTGRELWWSGSSTESGSADISPRPTTSSPPTIVPSSSSRPSVCGCPLKSSRASCLSNRSDAEARCPGPNSVGHVGRREMSIVTFDHPRVGVPKVLGHHN